MYYREDNRYREKSTCTEKEIRKWAKIETRTHEGDKWRERERESKR